MDNGESGSRVMLFAKDREFSQCEIDLVNNFLEKLIGKSKTRCRESAENQGFDFLDKWGTKMGFAKEVDDTHLILSLYFEDMECHFYQIIYKKEGEKWINSRMINSDIVRQKGVIDHNIK